MFNFSNQFLSWATSSRVSLLCSDSVRVMFGAAITGRKQEQLPRTQSWKEGHPTAEHDKKWKKKGKRTHFAQGLHIVSVRRASSRALSTICLIQLCLRTGSSCLRSSFCLVYIFMCVCLVLSHSCQVKAWTTSLVQLLHPLCHLWHFLIFHKHSAVSTLFFFFIHPFCLQLPKSALYIWFMLSLAFFFSV